jgi:type I restriction enzyme S subunit
LDFDDGVKQTNLRKEDVLNCPLLIPNDPKEQEKIAETLSSIDELINAQSQKLEALKLHKKGLLQGLFSDVNTISK